MPAVASVSPPQSLAGNHRTRSLLHQRSVDMSTPKLCIYHPRVVHSWLQDQCRTR